MKYCFLNFLCRKSKKDKMVIIKKMQSIQKRILRIFMQKMLTWSKIDFFLIFLKMEKERILLTRVKK
jgi:uncharacterized membrane protein YwzB